MRVHRRTWLTAALPAVTGAREVNGDPTRPAAGALMRTRSVALERALCSTTIDRLLVVLDSGVVLEANWTLRSVPDTSTRAVAWITALCPGLSVPSAQRTGRSVRQ